MPVIPSFSPVDVCNEALGQIGTSFITSLANTDRVSVLCNQYFPSLLSMMLREHKWNFAYKRVELGLEVDVPVSEFAHQFALPADCVRVFTLNGSEVEGWKVEQRKVLTDSTTAIIEYIAYIDDPNIWDAMFRQAYATLLASRLAGPLTGNMEEAQTLYNLYRVQLADAKAVDGQEGSTDVYTCTVLTDDIRD